MLALGDDPEENIASEPLAPWKVLIVDDEPEVHSVTKLVLGGFAFENRPLLFLSAYSGEQGQQALQDHPDIALMLLDVVMETDHAGLDLARWTRDELKNHFIRIVLRTGQPGHAPEQRVTTEYDINDYKEKTDLTTQKLTATVRVALRGYRDIMVIERARDGLERVIQASACIFSRQQSAEFASAVLLQLGSLVGLERGAFYVRVPPPERPELRHFPDTVRVSAATGEFERYLPNETQHQALPGELLHTLHDAFDARTHVFKRDHYVLHFSDSQHGESLLYVGDAWNMTQMDMRLVELFCTNVTIAYENLHLNQELFESQLEMICLLAGAAETRSKETANHVKRVGMLAQVLGELRGLDPHTCEALRFAAPLHDIGKIGVADSVLNKPGKHDEAEMAAMREHSVMGARMLAESRRPLIRMAADIAASHHENWDGSGYPKGLHGEQIPLSARIVALADVFDALGSKRCYKEPWSDEQIRAHIQEQSGLKFDPGLVGLALANWERLTEVRLQFPD
nr:response regulator [Pseudomarimonas arenosa]